MIEENTIIRETYGYVNVTKLCETTITNFKSALPGEVNDIITPCGKIDFTIQEIIEIEHISKWKNAYKRGLHYLKTYPHCNLHLYLFVFDTEVIDTENYIKEINNTNNLIDDVTELTIEKEENLKDFEPITMNYILKMENKISVIEKKGELELFKKDKEISNLKYEKDKEISNLKYEIELLKKDGEILKLKLEGEENYLI